MQIFYTNKLVFWSNEGNDYLEDNRFEAYMNDWTPVNNVKSINWTSHYSANFYASDAFEATYFKIIKNNKTYYFFIQNIEFDSAKGKQFYLTLDFYYTYGVQLIKALKQNNPLVVFKRKHANRLYDGRVSETYDIANHTNYLVNIPTYLQQYSNRIPNAYKDIKLNLDPNKIFQDFSDVSSAYIYINDNDYITRNNSYVYLKVKPNSAGFKTSNPWVDDVNQNEICYIPIKQKFPPNPDNKVLPNSYSAAKQWPASYVVGLVDTFIPPSKFLGASLVKNCYPTIEGLKTDESIILIALTSVWEEKNFVITLPATDSLNSLQLRPTYNIDNYMNEPLLWLEPFNKYKINDDYEFSLNTYLNIGGSGITSRIYFLYLISTDFFVIPDLSKELDGLTYYVNKAFKISREIPFSGDVYNDYLKSNINSMNTGIALAKEQNKITKDTAIANGTLGAISGVGNIVSSLLNPFGAIFGIGGAISGAAGIGSSITEGVMKAKQADFDLKSTIAKTDAKKADMRNEPDAVLDTYGVGVTQKDFSPLRITRMSISIPEQKMVFSDIYFHGYITNTVYKFNEYDNRISFNYFELGNVYQLATQYLKLPKQIIHDLAIKIEKGIRLWKTPNFDYTLTLDNRENKYANK